MVTKVNMRGLECDIIRTTEGKIGLHVDERSVKMWVHMMYTYDAVTLFTF